MGENGRARGQTTAPPKNKNAPPVRAWSPPAPEGRGAAGRRNAGPRRGVASKQERASGASNHAGRLRNGSVSAAAWHWRIGRLSVGRRLRGPGRCLSALPFINVLRPPQRRRHYKSVDFWSHLTERPSLLATALFVGVGFCGCHKDSGSLWAYRFGEWDNHSWQWSAPSVGPASRSEAHLARRLHVC